MAEDGARQIPYERLFGVGVIILLAGALALSEYGRFVQRDKLVKEVEVARADADAALKAVIEPSTVRTVEDSVYLVQVARTGEGGGTAFVIDRERGLLATAAHVVKSIDLDDEDAPTFIMNRATKKPLRVIGKRAHAGHGALNRMAEHYQPIDPQSPIEAAEVVPVYPFSFDAGLLIVDPVDPDSGENILGPALPIASVEDLLAIGPGEPIAIASFPGDAKFSRTGAAFAVESRADRGTVASVFAPIAPGFDSEDPRHAILIAHRMTTTGGSSGGPIFNDKGEIVGINIARSGHDRTAVRADAIYDLLSPLQEERRVAEFFAPEWRRRLSRAIKAEDAIPYFLYRAHGPIVPFQQDETLGDFDFSAERAYRAAISAEEFGERGEKTLPADDVASGKAPDLSSSRYSASARTAPLFRLPASARYRMRRETLAAGEKYVVFAFDYESNGGAREVGFYHRRLGESMFKDTGASMIPATTIQPATDGVYEFAFYRRLGA